MRLTHTYIVEQYEFDGEGDEQRIVLKTANDACADSLQSPQDEDATYRKKNDDKVREYNVHCPLTLTG